MPRYNHTQIEPKWQKYWEANHTFKADPLPKAQKLYVLDMFPYPSSDGLHVGHPEGWTATDIVCRFARMQGKSVLHPMGFDAFGLPAEEHAIKTNTPPRVQTKKNIDNFRRQTKMLGFSYDWDREVSTTDLDYFRWTQWIFLLIFDTWFDHDQQKGRPISELPIPDSVAADGERVIAAYRDEHRLAFQADALVNWCPALGTVLANEEVIDGKSERGDHPVERIPLRQWMLRITAYADRLEKDLGSLDWPRSIKLLQRNWIGRSTGAEVDFFIGARTNWHDFFIGTGTTADGLPPGEEWTTWVIEREQEGYPRKAGDEVLRVYTTRPDTLFGATYMVLAPEHPFVERLTTPQQSKAVKAYCEKAARKSDRERTEVVKEKTGVFTGSYAMNPVNGESIPIWIADYVLISYGTGAIMAVPAHDTRDFEFAEQFEIPIVAVVDPGEIKDVNREKVLSGKQVFTAEGTAVNSGAYDGLSTAEFKRMITEDLTSQGHGRGAVNYKLRDWLFSRQRFWGEPFPILHELDESGNKTGAIRAVSLEDLPVELPELEDYKPHGRSEPPLDKAPESWLYPVIDGTRYKRETNTMPQWAGSCWYYLRFIDPKNDTIFVDPEKEKAWMPVDLYIGGAEHAVLHLLYSRFWHKVLYDRGYVSTDEPFRKLVNQGMILGEVTYYIDEKKDANGQGTGEYMCCRCAQQEDLGTIQIPPESIGATIESINSKPTATVNGKELKCSQCGGPLECSGSAEKMSKSRGNVVNPDDIVREYGADSFRLYEMFMGPLEATKPWNTEGVNGVRGFLNRVWRMIVDDRADEMQLNSAVQEVEPTEEQNRVLHRTIKGVTQDIERLAFNTAIAKMMEFTNFFTKADSRPKIAMERLVLLLSPLAPHISEELWQCLGHADTLAYEPWPQYDEALIQQDTLEIPVQINGKVRSRVRVPVEASQDDLARAAREDSKIAGQIAGKTIIKTIVVPGRLVNFVVK